jgi:hypothetical protein
MYLFDTEVIIMKVVANVDSSNACPAFIHLIGSYMRRWRRWPALHGFCLLLLFFTREHDWENLSSISPPDSPWPRDPRSDREVVDSSELAQLSLDHQLSLPAHQLGLTHQLR